MSQQIMNYCPLELDSFRFCHWPMNKLEDSIETHNIITTKLGSFVLYNKIILHRQVLARYYFQGDKTKSDRISRRGIAILSAPCIDVQVEIQSHLLMAWPSWT